MIDLSVERPISLAEACRLVPPGRGGRRTHLSTILRWIQKGAKAPGGAVVRLEGLRVGGRWLTSREALQRFAVRLTPRLGDAPAPDSPPGPRTPRQRRWASERAATELKKAGIG